MCVCVVCTCVCVCVYMQVALMTFLEELTNCRLKPERKAQLCQAAEREYAGTCI